MSNMIISKEAEREKAFRALIRNLKCPFRLKKMVHGSDTWEEMMPCDPDCAAMINRVDKTAFSCLRLMSVQYPLEYEHGIEIFHGLDEEED